jgi:hypothetical protein
VRGGGVWAHPAQRPDPGYQPLSFALLASKKSSST